VLRSEVHRICDSCYHRAVLKNDGSILYRVDNLPYQRQRYPHGCFVYGACVVRKEHVHAGAPEAQEQERQE